MFTVDFVRIITINSFFHLLTDFRTSQSEVDARLSSFMLTLLKHDFQIDFSTNIFQCGDFECRINLNLSGDLLRSLRFAEFECDAISPIHIAHSHK